MSYLTRLPNKKIPPLIHPEDEEAWRLFWECSSDHPDWEVPDVNWDKVPTADELEAILAKKREDANMLEDLYSLIGG